jgi:hypothetical protein
MNIKKLPSKDGTIDEDYTWGRPVTTYVSTLTHMRLLLLKARIDTTGAVDEVPDADTRPDSASVAAEILMRVPPAWRG